MAENTSGRLATVYAEALYGAAAGVDALPGVRGDVESLQRLLQEYPRYGQMLGDPKTDPARRDEAIRRAFEGRVHTLTLNFLLVLSRRWRLGGLAAILDVYVELDNGRRLGRREVEVVSAAALDAGMLERVRQGIAAWGGSSR